MAEFVEKWPLALEALKAEVSGLGNMEMPNESAANFLPDALRVLRRYFGRVPLGMLETLVFEAALQLSDEGHSKFLRQPMIRSAFNLCVLRQTLMLVPETGQSDAVEFGPAFMRADVSASRPTLPIPKILNGFSEIAAALRMPDNETTKRKLRYATKNKGAPIVLGKKGQPPRADEAKLIAWHSASLDSVEIDSSTSRLEFPASGAAGDRVYSGNKAMGHIRGNARGAGHLQKDRTKNKGN